MTSDGLDLLLLPGPPRNYLTGNLSRINDLVEYSDNGRLPVGVLSRVPTIADVISSDRFGVVWDQGFGEPDGGVGQVAFQFGDDEQTHSGLIPVYGRRVYDKPLQVVSIQHVQPSPISYEVVHWVFDPVSRKRFILGSFASDIRFGPLEAIKQAAERRNSVVKLIRDGETPVDDRSLERKLMQNVRRLDQPS